MYRKWLEAIPWTREDFKRFWDHGMPIDYARAIEEASEGDVPVTMWPRLIHSPKVLHKRLRSSTVNSDMHSEQRIAISKGQGGDPAFRKAIQAKGYTQNALARAVGVSPAVLSLHRNRLRKIPRSRAEAIQKLTGWPADGKHWPVGIVSDEE